ncbi:MAG: Uma2 family endonuclease [Ktedonobacteraceae bacterium]
MVADRFQVSDGIYMTEEQYLALEETTDGKYERLNGMVTMLRPPSSLQEADATILDMAGGSDAHAALCVRLGTLLSNQLEDAPCLVYSSDRRLKLPQGGNHLFPDLTVACGEETTSQVMAPTVILEVLSPATEKRDRGAKLAAYKTLPSLAEYVLIGSEIKEIIVYRRESNWRPYHYQSGDMVELISIGVSFPFDAVYRRIPL